MNCRSYVVFFILCSWLFLCRELQAQETNSHTSGRVLSDNEEALVGASIVLVHEPTQSTYRAVSRPDGYFYFFHLQPGGPYKILIYSAGYDSLLRTDLYLHFAGGHLSAGGSAVADFVLTRNIVTLGEVVVKARLADRHNTGVETDITPLALQFLPSISRGFHDFIRLVPQAKITGDGGMSLAGQNNRFNAFFIDGTSNTDIYGLSPNGINGGLTGAPPVSIEAIEEVKVLLAPYDVQYGNFTGGSINAITRSGSNEVKASAWYYFRNEQLAGRSPQPLEKPGPPGEFYRPRLSPFFNQTAGVWNSGPLLKSKLFYFALLERQSEVKPQPFNISEYRGGSSRQQLAALADTLRTKYSYDPGSFLESKDALSALRLNLKFDWNSSSRDKFMLSYRYHYAERTASTLVSSANTIAFRNSGFILPARTHSAALEWKHFFTGDRNNRLLLTGTHHWESRKELGQPFPRVTIADANGSIVFGSDVNTAVNHFRGTDLTLFNAFKFIKGPRVFTLGLEATYSRLDAANIPNFFGTYQFRSLGDFLKGSPPSRLQRSFLMAGEPLDVEREASTRFSTLRVSSFINDAIRIGTRLWLTMGLRLDMNSVPAKPQADKFFNDTAMRTIAAYYDLDGAVSGRMMQPHWAVSPRAGVDYKLPKYGLNLRGGAGVFVGRIVNLWTINQFNNKAGSLDLNPQQYGVGFTAAPYRQPTPETLGVDASGFRGDLNLVARNFKFPAVFRTSLTAEKNVGRWEFSVEGILTRNIHEAAFRSVNIVPPLGRSAAPGSRNIYSLNATPDFIPVGVNGKNPYAQVFLLTNNEGKKGYSYSLSFIVNKQVNGFLLNSSYTYGRSNVLFEITGPTTPIRAQWRNMETVDGRNFVALSTSDNELQPRVTTWVSQKVTYANGRAATTLSLFYNGQSGAPYSYVYSGSMINDNGRLENFDLVYIPTPAELASMHFVPITNNGGQVEYSAQQQKDLLNAFIEGDRYLRRHRGGFARRNGARLPFTHTVDLRLQQDLTIKVKGRRVGVAITYDVFNFTNMLHKGWGDSYFLTGDNFPLIQFAGYYDRATLTPQYQFRPLGGRPYSLQASTVPGNSARWISQLGIRISAG